MTDADALAIKAYLFSLRARACRQSADTLSFPFNQRWAMGFWSVLFNPDTRFQPHTSRSPEWNRGAYLAEALAHCGECHTPRNLAFALDNRRKFAGAVTAGWRAYNITSRSQAPASAPGATTSSPIIWRPATRPAAAPRPARWARRWTRASAC